MSQTGTLTVAEMEEIFGKEDYTSNLTSFTEHNAGNATTYDNSTDPTMSERVENLSETFEEADLFVSRGTTKSGDWKVEYRKSGDDYDYTVFNSANMPEGEIERMVVPPNL